MTSSRRNLFKKDVNHSYMPLGNPDKNKKEISYSNNKEMNLFYISAGITAFAESLMTLFVPIYFYKLGFSVSLILFYYFLAATAVIIFAFPAAKIISRIGVKKAILLSTPFAIVYYLGLRQIPAIHLFFYILPFLLSFSRVVYNTSFHLYFAVNSQPQQRGRELSLLRGAMAIGSVLGPLLGGIISAFWGFFTLYSLGAVILILAAVPLFFAGEKKNILSFMMTDLWKNIATKNYGNFLSFSSYAIETTIDVVLWPIFLTIILLTTVKTGFVVALSLFLSLMVFYVIGKVTDSYDKTKLLSFTTFLYFAAWLGRIFATTGTRIVIIDWYKHVAQKLLHIPWETRTFDLAIRQGYFTFLVQREIIFNLARLIAIPILMIIFYFNVYPFIISFGLAAVVSLGYILLEKG